MNHETNKALVRRYIDMWNTGNETFAESVLAPTYLDHAHPEVAGPDSVVQALRRIRTTFQDFHITIDAMIGEDDLVALRGTIRMTQQKSPSVSHVIWFVRISDGRMAELWTGAESLQ